MNSSTVAAPAISSIVPNIGETIAAVLAAKRRKYRATNAPIDNFPFLLEASGARDEGGYRASWYMKKEGGIYVGFSAYRFSWAPSVNPLVHPDTREHLPRIGRRATTRELLSTWNDNRAELMAVLESGNRLIAVGRDDLNFETAARLRLDGTKRLVLDRIKLGISLRLSSRDLILNRI
ncbi:MAG: hypothetical protein KGI79_01240 [Patescibacteria group bacterium]|nr:hypothetical protein [Patescibacteria group bacterium]MDE2116482.1 hypothetical protein [Patescibacteria group bacterium]